MTQTRQCGHMARSVGSLNSLATRVRSHRPTPTNGPIAATAIGKPEHLGVGRFQAAMRPIRRTCKRHGATSSANSGHGAVGLPTPGGFERVTRCYHFRA